ncbi:hypothetical protein [Streptosporangium sp. NPDC049644]|uniref:hypothetical protein n=1 Tax=Streptosporangium sp. NPDC049644 TaxID=3155507 RepID=UPI003442E347
MSTGKAFLTLACAALMLTGCATSSWENIGGAKLSADERTLTVELILDAPSRFEKPCERVKDTEINESSSQVVIGIQVEKDCPRQWPWEEPVFTNLVGHPYPVKFKLERPLAGRTVVNNTNGHRVRIYPEEGTSR